MKLTELAYVVGDDGGLHRHINDAIKNMEHHSKHHADEKVRKMCKQAISGLQGHMQRPLSLYDDPHTFLKLIQPLKGEPDLNHLSHVVNTLGTYTQTDND